MALEPAPPMWTIIIPVKDTTLAKSRLRRFTQDQRAMLALAFAVDAATAALGCAAVRRVIAVTNDAGAADLLTAAGLDVLSDAPDSGINPALTHAASVVRTTDGGAAVAAMSADLPALTAETLDIAFAAAGTGRWFVADAHGVGTTLLAAGGGKALAPRFGPGSRAAHRRSGAHELEASGLERLRRDVDTESDLWEALRLGIGENTSATLRRLGIEPLP